MMEIEVGVGVGVGTVGAGVGYGVGETVMEVDAGDGVGVEAGLGAGVGVGGGGRHEVVSSAPTIAPGGGKTLKDARAVPPAQFTPEIRGQIIDVVVQRLSNTGDVDFLNQLVKVGTELGKISHQQI